MFFYLVALINFFENRLNVFFTKYFFLPPSLIRFWIISDLKQRNKNKWPGIKDNSGEGEGWRDGGGAI